MEEQATWVSTLQMALQDYKKLGPWHARQAQVHDDGAQITACNIARTRRVVPSRRSPARAAAVLRSS